MASPAYTSTIRERLRDEVGAIAKQAPLRIALAYPSPYSVGMSSLGYQRIYRAIQEEAGMCCERTFLPDDEHADSTPLTYESLRPISAFPIVAFSVAYDLEVAGLLRMLMASKIPVLRDERSEHHPFIVAGGPLTFSNPLPLAPFVDAIVMGEAEVLSLEVFRIIDGASSRAEALKQLAETPHVYVPEHHGDRLPQLAKVDDEVLPAWAAIRTPHTELRDMFLIETERGCSRGCAYCVMRRSTNGGMRIVPKEKVMSLIPEDAKRIGLVGAAVSDHPKIVEIVTELADRGCEVGLSSLRPDKLTDPFVGALKKAGYKTLTTAMDGTSERVRELLDRRARVKHLERAAELAREHGMERLKLYLMIGVPGETDEDVDECVKLTTALSKRIPVALGIAPFCSKRNTPLDGQPYAGISVVDRRLDRLRRGLQGRADVRATSARWAWIEHELSQGGPETGLAVLEAVRQGGGFAAYKRAFTAIEKRRARPKLAVIS